MRAFLPVALFSFAVTACGGGGDDGPGPDPSEPTDPEDPPTPEETARDYDELANIIGAHVRGEFALQLQAAEISRNRYPEGWAMTASSIEQTTGTGVDGSMSYEFALHCNDGSQTHTKVACDGTAHHSHVKLTISGSQSVGAMAMDQISRVVDWEIRDLTVEKARFRGPDLVSLQTQVTTDGEAATYKVSFDAVYEQVRFLPGHEFPTFGTINFNLNVDRMRGSDHRVFDAAAVLTYGSSGVPTTLTIDGMHDYTINLVSGAIVKL